MAGNFISCHDDYAETFNDGKGTLLINNISVNVDTSDNLLTKAAGTFTPPDVSDLTYTVIDNETKEIAFNEVGGFSSLSLKSGSYTLEISYSENVVSSEYPYLYASKNFVIEQGKTTAVSDLVVELGCSIIRPYLSDEVLSYFDASSIVINISEENDQKLTPVENNHDCFVPSGKSYKLYFVGNNTLGEIKSFSCTVNNVALKNRYTINYTPNLPAFTLPQQNDIDVWGSKVYITPMTSENMTNKAEIADKVISNIVYEASSDNITWLKSELESDRIVIKGLQPNTTYTIRSRFENIISSNSQVVTTEAAQQIQNNSFEDWTQTKLYSGNGSWSANIYCDYCTGWSTRNERTTLGAENANSGGIGLNKGSGYGVKYRWRSNTVSVEDATQGSKGAEIATLAFYNQNVYGSWTRANILTSVQGDGTPFTGYLFTGSFDKSSDSYSLGISHTSRPLSLSFDYKYSPVSGDECIVYAKLYDLEKNIIAETTEFKSSTQSEYINKTLDFVYKNQFVKAAYIGVFFQSGTDVALNKMVQIEGSYNITPFNQDYVVGSILRIDNVNLNY